MVVEDEARGFQGYENAQCAQGNILFPSQHVHIENHLSFVPITATPKGFFAALQIPFVLLRCITLGFLQTTNGQ